MNVSNNTDNPTLTSTVQLPPPPATSGRFATYQVLANPPSIATLNQTADHNKVSGKTVHPPQTQSGMCRRHIVPQNQSTPTAIGYDATKDDSIDAVYNLDEFQIQKPEASKKGQCKYFDQILSHIVAHLNTNGGRLQVISSGNVADTARDITQRIRSRIGTVVLINFISFELLSDSVIVNTKPSPTLVILDYGLAYANSHETFILSGYYDLWQISKFQSKPEYTPATSMLDATPLNYSETFSTRQDRIYKCKMHQTQSTRRTTLVDRIIGTGSKFTLYISGFANHQGGSVLYGIDENSTIMGLDLAEFDTDKIKTKLSKTISSKLCWSEGIKLQEGEHYGIWLHPVNHAPSKDYYVIEIAVSALSGFVFYDTPRSYKLNRKRLPELMPDQEWQTKLMHDHRYPSSPEFPLTSTTETLPQTSKQQPPKDGLLTTPEPLTSQPLAASVEPSAEIANVEATETSTTSESSNPSFCDALYSQLSTIYQGTEQQHQYSVAQMNIKDAHTLRRVKGALAEALLLLKASGHITHKPQEHKEPAHAKKVEPMPHPADE